MAENKFTKMSTPCWLSFALPESTRYVLIRTTGEVIAYDHRPLRQERGRHVYTIEDPALRPPEDRLHEIYPWYRVVQAWWQGARRGGLTWRTVAKSMWVLYAIAPPDLAEDVRLLANLAYRLHDKE